MNTPTTDKAPPMPLKWFNRMNSDADRQPTAKQRAAVRARHRAIWLDYWQRHKDVEDFRRVYL